MSVGTRGSDDGRLMGASVVGEEAGEEGEGEEDKEEEGGAGGCGSELMAGWSKNSWKEIRSTGSFFRSFRMRSFKSSPTLGTSSDFSSGKRILSLFC